MIASRLYAKLEALLENVNDGTNVRFAASIPFTATSASGHRADDHNQPTAKTRARTEEPRFNSRFREPDLAWSQRPRCVALVTDDNSSRIYR